MNQFQIIYKINYRFIYLSTRKLDVLPNSTFCLQTQYNLEPAMKDLFEPPAEPIILDFALKTKKCSEDLNFT